MQTQYQACNKFGLLSEKHLNMIRFAQTPEEYKKMLHNTEQEDATDHDWHLTEEEKARKTVPDGAG